MAGADFRDRIRRPAYAATLAAAVALAYLAVPAADARWTIMNVGDYRGAYNSAYVGTATALAGALWLTLGGFYFVRTAIGRDESTRVGQLLAATPLRTTTYLAAKFLGNVMVLASMVGVLAGTAAVMQIVRGEDRAIDPVALLLPFATVTLPLVVATAAAALLFEAIPHLRAGLGNIVWFFMATTVALGGQSGSAPLGGLGVHAAVVSMRERLLAEHADLSGQEFSLGLTYRDEPLRTFDWAGFTPDGAFLGRRLLLILLALGLALLPALWFGRFDPARGPLRGPVPDVPHDPHVPHEPTRLQTAPRHRTAPATLPRTPAVVRGFAFPRLLVGELRILLQGVSKWWWIGAATLTLAGFTATPSVVTGAVLPACWIWPVLLWSRLGTQQTEHDLDGLLGAYPTPHLRLLAQWTAGLVLTVIAALSPAVRMLAAADTPGLTAWAAGALLIPSLALFVGRLSRTQRFFQALYVAVWWGIVNNIGALDFMGALRHDDIPRGPHPLLVTLVALTALAAAFAVNGLRDRGRR
ncbi:ABC transporter permease [Streptomyces sp. SID3343]|uniref:ABC transporter permease n=1 Tax=Streptomyces sp. SID3343 TaxID=2690260 RepID=UPI001371410D|nr:ABC transporter permease [Streptomyces sp. SID3343]MYW03906.1 hypothetical protein [Streptomyces sp. SID3343]